MYVLWATVLVLQLCSFTEEKQPSIKWQILNPPISFGFDVELYCNASVAKDCCTNTATWMKDFDIIVHHGASIDTSKYTQKQRIDGFSLIITKFNENDINHQYSCLYDFFSYSEVLKLNPNLMRYEPNKEDIQTNISMSDNLIVGVVQFAMIYPSPECNFVVNGEQTATNVTIAEKKTIRLFYKMKIHLVCEINKITWIDSVTINCTIGGDTMVLDKNNEFSCPECTGRKYNVDKTEVIWIGSKEDLTTVSFANEITEKTTSFSIIFPSIVTTCVVVVISLMIWRKKKNNARRTNFNDEDGDLLSTSTERSCSVLFWRQPTILIITSETTPLLQTHTSSVTITRVTIIYLPAQTNKDVTELLRYVILFDYSYTLKISTDIRINAARKSIQTKSVNPFICWSNYTETSTHLAKSIYRNNVQQISDKFSNKHQQTTNVEMKLIESNRMIHRIILEVNAFLEALTSVRLLRFTWNDKPVESIKSSSSSTVVLNFNYSTRPKRSPVHTAQKAKDVGRLIIYATLHDRAYIQRIITDIGINLARCRSNIDGLNEFTCLILSVARKGHRNAAWVFCPAQKDVNNILYYATLCDKTYIQKLVTNTRINIARKNKPVESKTPRSTQFDSSKSNASIYDVRRAALRIPKWGWNG